MERWEEKESKSVFILMNALLVKRGKNPFTREPLQE